jgi:hypothetical protein
MSQGQAVTQYDADPCVIALRRHRDALRVALRAEGEREHESRKALKRACSAIDRQIAKVDDELLRIRRVYYPAAPESL